MQLSYLKKKKQKQKTKRTLKVLLYHVEKNIKKKHIN